MSKDPNFDYQALALRTLSLNFHGELVDYQTLRNALNNVIDACAILDACKKALFYGKRSEVVLPSNGSKDCTEVGKDMDVPTQALAHAIIGCATEAGEMLEVLLDHLDGKPIDTLNLVEEMGDVQWYQAVGCQMINTNFDEVQRKNIAKLQVRYPDKFTSEDANQRNLFEEKSALLNT